MKTIGFFNSRGGIGQTSLVYHLAWMLAGLGERVLAVDLDPQVGLTGMCLDDDRLEAIWNTDQAPTLFSAAQPSLGQPDNISAVIEPLDDNLGLLCGDPRLAKVEDTLAEAWLRRAESDPAATREMTAFSRAIALAGTTYGAKVALIDIGPNLGALNRAALRGCDFIVSPVGPDRLSLQGLRDTGLTLRIWGGGSGCAGMRPAGYIVLRNIVRSGRPARDIARWTARFPDTYHCDVLNEATTGVLRVEDDAACLGVLKDYWSLLPLAQEAQKPIFALRPADGAFGGHQTAVTEAWRDYRQLAGRVMAGCGMSLKP